MSIMLKMIMMMKYLMVISWWWMWYPQMVSSILRLVTPCGLGFTQARLSPWELLFMWLCPQACSPVVCPTGHSNPWLCLDFTTLVISYSELEHHRPITLLTKAKPFQGFPPWDLFSRGFPSPLAELCYHLSVAI